jgi:hypothetical protein
MAEKARPFFEVLCFLENAKWTYTKPWVAIITGATIVVIRATPTPTAAIPTTVMSPAMVTMVTSMVMSTAYLNDVAVVLRSNCSLCWCACSEQENSAKSQ